MESLGRWGLAGVLVVGGLVVGVGVGLGGAIAVVSLIRTAVRDRATSHR